MPRKPDSVTIHIHAGRETHTITVHGYLTADSFSPESAYLGDHPDNVWSLLSECWNIEERAIAAWDEREAERRREGDVDGKIAERKLRELEAA